ncbi:MAG TPA: MotA/TolQ/ExbB proton channel family protein [bacterium]
MIRLYTTHLNRHRMVMAFLWLPLTVFANPSSTRIHITGISRVVHTNWLKVPRTADYTIYWDAFQTGPAGWIQAGPGRYNAFRVMCQSDSEIRRMNVSGNFTIFTDCRAGKKYLFVVEGMDDLQNVVAVSDTASIVTGKPPASRFGGRLSAQGPVQQTKWHHWFPFNGRIPLALMGVGQVFDVSSLLGKICFHLIWGLFLVGLFIWLRYCVPNLRLSKIFPLTHERILWKGYDESYRRRESPEFRKLLSDWRDIMVKANQNVRNELKQGEQIDVQDVSESNVRFWRDHGNRAIRELVKRISDQGLERYPTIRVIRAGLSNHEVGGFRWLEVSKEVERAIENQASSELETLRRKTMFEQLWNIATIEPLLGLFGTVTGISAAFGLLSTLPEDITQISLINKLSGGIYEALWTTIEGLFVGIVFSIAYYYYQRKMDWVYSKWEEIYVYVAEKL